jgi:hypothetical protein
MDPIASRRQLLTRRSLLQGASSMLGTAALASLLRGEGLRGGEASSSRGGSLPAPHFKPRAKRVIYLFMADAPSQIDMWDHKPTLTDHYDQDLPDSIRNGQRITTMTSGQARFPVAPSKFKFTQNGKAGTWVTELLPHMAKRVDDIAVIRSMNTESINHDPGITFMQTGAEQPGRPSMGAWLSYGLGSPNRDLPAYVVLHSSWSAKAGTQALFSRLWGAGFLPSKHQGVALRSEGDPVLYLADPAGVDASSRRRMLDSIERLNHEQYEQLGDPETLTRIEQYEMAFRMQTSVPDLVNIANEPESVLSLYGPDVNKAGTFARNCLLARRLAERGVPFVQVFIRGWDQHGSLERDLPLQCGDIDQACAGLLLDLEQRGMLDDTLVVWGGEFGRTVYCQGPLSREAYGRDHHPRCFSMWIAGGGAKRGIVHGETDDYSYNVVKDPVHVHDLHATLLYLLGIDHEHLTYRFQGRDFRLTDVHGKVVRELCA